MALEGRLVSMKSGLRDRNNPNGFKFVGKLDALVVSMKSGLRDRNNLSAMRT